MYRRFLHICQICQDGTARTRGPSGSNTHDGLRSTTYARKARAQISFPFHFQHFQHFQPIAQQHLADQIRAGAVNHPDSKDPPVPIRTHAVQLYYNSPVWQY